MIRNFENQDITAITSIYNYYIRTSIATFEEEEITEEEMKKRIDEKTKRFPCLVYELENQILGYAYAGEWNNRCAYRNTVEVSIYLNTEATGKGIGTILYAELLNWLKQNSFRVIIGGISLPNKASEQLHEKFGFKKVAHFEEVGYKFGKWIDVGYWQLINRV